MYAVVQTGGKQYKVTEGLIFRTESLNEAVGNKVNLQVLMYSDDKSVLVGKDAEKISVVAEVVGHGKGDKIIVFTYKAKKNERTKQGHRQPFTALKVVSISVGK